MANQLLMPDMLGSVNRGVEYGKQNRLAQLAGEAYSAAPDQRRGIIGDMVSINPRAGLAMGNTLQAQEQAQEADHQKKLAQAASFMLKAKQSGNPQAVQGAWNAVRPYLSQLTGQQVPDQFDENMWPAIYQVAAQSGAELPQPEKGVVVAPGSQIFDPRTGRMIANNPAALQYKNVPMGAGTAAGVFDPATGQVRPATSAPQMAQQADPMDVLLAQANQRVQSGEDPDAVESWLRQQAQGHGMQVNGGGQAQGMPQTPAQGATFGIGVKPSADKIATRSRELQELRARGLDISDADAQNYLATGKMGSGFQGNSTADAFGDPSVEGEAYLQTIPESERAVVKGVLNGTKSLPTGSALKSPYWQSVMASVMHADPSWNEAAYRQYATTRKEFTTGRQGRVINSINTAMQHAHELMESIDALDNPDFRPLAAAKNLNRYFGNQDVTNFNSVVTALASEMASVYKNGNAPTDQETQEWREQITPNMSKGQQMNVLRRWISLLSGKMNAVRRQYRQGMSDLAEPLTVVSKPAREAMERIYDMADQFSDQENPAAPALNDAPIYAPGGTVPRSGGDVSQQGGQQPMQQQPQGAPRATNPQTGETVVWDSSKHAWVPEQ